GDHRRPRRAGLSGRLPALRGAGGGGVARAAPGGGRGRGPSDGRALVPHHAGEAHVAKTGLGTRAVHGSRGPRPGPLTTPIVQSSTFVFDSTAELRRYLEGDEELYLYTRYANPTLVELED